MNNVEKIRVTQAADLLTIPATIADMLVVVDRAVAIASGTMPLPANPVDGQIFVLATRVDITALTLDGGAHPISGGVATIKGGDSKAWFYDLASDRWFRYLSDQSEISATLGTKQDALSSATNIKTINGASLLGSGDLAVNQIAAVVYSRVTGSDASTTGQALVDITGLSNALVANAVYEFEAVMSCTVSAVTTGISYGVQFSAAGATVEANISAASSTTATKTERISAFNAATTAFLASSGQSGGVNIRGTIVTGANPGNLTIRHLKITSGTSTVRINSFLRTIRIS